MTRRMYRALVAALSVAALTLAASETFARGRFTSTRSVFRPSVAHALRHHRRNVGAFWPAVEDYPYGPSTGVPMVDFTQPASRDIQYTYKYDVPWDWAHRFPPTVTPSARPYVPGCSAERVMVPGRDGGEQTVNVTRCY